MSAETTIDLTVRNVTRLVEAQDARVAGLLRLLEQERAKSARLRAGLEFQREAKYAVIRAYRDIYERWTRPPWEETSSYFDQGAIPEGELATVATSYATGYSQQARSCGYDRIVDAVEDGQGNLRLYRRRRRFWPWARQDAFHPAGEWLSVTSYSSKPGGGGAYCVVQLRP